jgi:hypothetical protein
MSEGFALGEPTKGRALLKPLAALDADAFIQKMEFQRPLAFDACRAKPCRVARAVPLHLPLA